MFLDFEEKKNLIFENLCHFRKEKNNWTFFYSKPNSFQVKKKKKEKAEPYIFKIYNISEKKKKTEPFFEKNNLGFFWNKTVFGEK
jgi:hypothetical protein